MRTTRACCTATSNRPTFCSTHQGTVWLTDFGLAKAAQSDDFSLSQGIVGTLRYMAPEQFGGQSDHRSDIYSLGLTLYELLALRPAYEETTRAS